MLLSRIERWIVFALFCLAIIVVIALETYLVLAMAQDGFTWGKGVGAILNSGLLAGSGAIFVKLLVANFLEREILPMSRLHRLAADRSGIVENGRRGDQEEYETRRLLVTETLRFAEETLHGWVPGSHFEFCAFLDAEQPLLFAYFDSKHASTARSMAQRELSATYYVENGYEVTKLLREPTSHPRVLKNTQEAQSDYVFTTGEQRKQLRSTILLCLDIVTPCALVVTSNAKNAFNETDPQIMSFIQFVGETVRCDLFENGFIDRIREMKPKLFLPS